MRHMSALKAERRSVEDAAATKISSRWRAHAATDAYTLTLVDIVLIQSVTRRKAAQKLVAGIKEQVKSDAATIISSNWRRFACSTEYESTVEGAY